MGAVIGFDGIAGCGKTTLVRTLTSRFPDAVTTRVFGDHRDRDAEARPVGLWLYRHAMEPEHGWDEHERQLAFALAARRHYRCVLPELRREAAVVLSDRSFLSVLAYSAVVGNEAAAMAAWALESQAAEDIVFWVDTPTDVAQARRRPASSLASSARAPRPGDNPLAVRAQYERLAHEMPRTVVRLDGALPAWDLAEVAAALLDQWESGKPELH